jgi:hypothetical protein
VALGHARDIGDAFERYLAVGKAFVPRAGRRPMSSNSSRAPAAWSSFAHPGKLGLTISWRRSRRA